MNNLYEFTENELKEVDRLKEWYGCATRQEAIRKAIRNALIEFELNEAAIKIYLPGDSDLH